MTLTALGSFYVVGMPNVRLPDEVLFLANLSLDVPSSYKLESAKLGLLMQVAGVH